MITANDVKKLREETGCGMMECKKALVYGDGDFRVAKAYLMAVSLAVATPKMTFDQRVQSFLESVP